MNVSRQRDRSRFLSVALDALGAGEAVVVSQYGARLPATLKADGSPVTAADIKAQEMITSVIARAFPDHRIIGEEESSDRPQSGDEFVWIIDPIDGTKNFIAGIPLFGIQVALFHDRAPILGVSKLPMLGELLYAERGGRAYLNETPARVSDVASLSGASITLGGLTHFVRSNEWKVVEQLARGAGRIRAIGDSFAYHLVASGRCDAVIEAEVRIWDIAPFLAIIEAAGGRCSDLAGRPITFESTNVVCSNGGIHDELLELIATDM